MTIGLPAKTEWHIYQTEPALLKLTMQQDVAALLSADTKNKKAIRLSADQ